MKNFSIAGPKDMLGPMPDESLHSFIFRMLTRIGHEDFTTLIVNGGWGNKPSVPFSSKHEIANFDPNELIKLFSKNTRIKKNDNLFSNCYEYMSDFNSIFFPDRKKYYAGQRLPVRYCKSCIKEQITRFGFGFFMRHWIYDDYCFVHQKYLIEIEHILPPNQLQSAIIVAMRGKEVNNSHKIRQPNQKHQELTAKSEQDKYIQLAPCLVSQFRNWVYAQHEFYRDTYMNIATYSLLTEYGNQVLSKYNYRQDIERHTIKYFEFAIEYNYKSVMSFLNTNSEFMAVHFENEFIKGGTKWVVKAKNKDCYKCTESEVKGRNQCPANKVISICHLQNVSVKQLGLPALHKSKNVENKLCNLLLKDPQHPLYRQKLSSFSLDCDRVPRKLIDFVYDNQDLMSIKTGAKRVKEEIEYSQKLKSAGGYDAYHDSIRATIGDIFKRMNRI